MPLWEENFSAVKKHIKSLEKEKISDFRSYFQNNPDEVRRCVQLVKINDVNNSVLNLHKVGSKDEFYNGISSVFTDSSYDAFIEELVTIAEGRLECEFESLVKTSKGEEKEVHLKWMVVPGYEETLEKVYLSTIDITDRKNAEIEIRKSQKQLDQTSKMAKVGGWEIDLFGNTLRWTSETFRIHELSEDKMPNVADAIQYYHPDDQEMVQNYVQEAIENGVSFDFDARIITAQKNTKWVRAYGKIVMQNGKKVILQGMIQDITERRQAEEELRKHRENLEELVNDRTKELESKNNLLERVNKAFVGRELKMKKLKQEIKTLKEKL